MQKSFSVILTNTQRSKFYFKEIKKNKIYVENIIFYSLKKNNDFLLQLKKYKFKNKLKIINSNNINSFLVKKEILLIKSEYVLFSGNNAELVKDSDILKLNLIHCHPGLLPKYRGSTVIYYSLIESNSIYVTVFIITKSIDKGKILYTKKFYLPKNRKDIERNFDHSIRSKALIYFLKSKNYKSKSISKRYDNLYYISHPIIRSIVLNTNFLLKNIK